jgi:hypothetical protein
LSGRTMARLEILIGVHGYSPPSPRVRQESDSFINLCVISKECKRVEK